MVLYKASVIQRQRRPYLYLSPFLTQELLQVLRGARDRLSRVRDLRAALNKFTFHERRHRQETLAQPCGQLTFEYVSRNVTI